MKQALILLAQSSTLALAGCQREAPPVVQVGATGDDGAKGDKGRTGATVVVLPRR